MAQVDKSFRPLAGSMVSEPHGMGLMVPHVKSFRPLAGIKVSELNGKVVFCIEPMVSVPSRGLRYLNVELVFLRKFIQPFPSPRGE